MSVPFGASVEEGKCSPRLIGPASIATGLLSVKPLMSSESWRVKVEASWRVLRVGAARATVKRTAADAKIVAFILKYGK